MLNLVEIKFGSHLYGTATPASDLDLKRVHLPSAEDILLQRAKGVVSTKTKADMTAKNTADDVDIEAISLQRFLGLAAEGQTVAIDMLFAPEWSWTGPAHPIWETVVRCRPRLLSRQHASFVGYCRSQANKYGIRGSRVAAARAALAMLAVAGKDSNAKLGLMADEINMMANTMEHMAVLNIPSQAGTDILHWEVCGRKMPFTSSIKSAHDIMDRVVREYGHRALAAEKNEGVDWKAISHAVRIAEQAMELLTTGHITFPRPNAEELREIKLGLLVYNKVAERIDHLLMAVEAAASSSKLPEKPDLDFIDRLVMETYGGVVRGVIA